VLITRCQSLIAGASLTLLDATGRGHTHDVETPHLVRAGPAITQAAASWSQLGSRWHDLTRPSDRLDPPLAAAAAEVRAAYRELTHDVTTQAQPEAIATRPGLGRGVAASLDALAAASELAHGVAEHADRKDLTGPARVLSRRAHDDVEAGLSTAELDDDQVWFSPMDILAKRLVRLPPPVVARLLRVSAEVVHHAMSASAVAQVQSRSRTSNVSDDVATTGTRFLAAASVPAPTAVRRSRK